MASVTLKSLTKRWGPVTVVREVSLLVADQEFVVFLGPSGSGKTTTMRMIAGLEEPTTGEIWIGDVNRGGSPNRPHAESVQRLGEASTNERSRMERVANNA